MTHRCRAQGQTSIDQITGDRLVCMQLTIKRTAAGVGRSIYTGQLRLVSPDGSERQAVLLNGSTDWQIQSGGGDLTPATVAGASATYPCASPRPAPTGRSRWNTSRTT